MIQDSVQRALKESLSGKKRKEQHNIEEIDVASNKDDDEITLSEFDNINLNSHK